MKNITIYIDVDLTLIDHNGEIIDGAVNMVRKLSEEDTRLYLWSTAGKEYCENVAKRLDIYNLFEGFGAKPDIIIDDMPATCLEPFVFNPNDSDSLAELTDDLIKKHID